MDFSQVAAEFSKLKAQYDAGALTEADFKARLQDLMIQDEQGRWWMIGYETGRWYVHDGENWVQREPPSAAEQSQGRPEAKRQESETAPEAAPGPAEARGQVGQVTRPAAPVQPAAPPAVPCRRGWVWMAAAAIGIIALDSPVHVLCSRASLARKRAAVRSLGSDFGPTGM